MPTHNFIWDTLILFESIRYSLALYYLGSPLRNGSGPLPTGVIVLLWNCLLSKHSKGRERTRFLPRKALRRSHSLPCCQMSKCCNFVQNVPKHRLLKWFEIRQKIYLQSLKGLRYPSQMWFRMLFAPEIFISIPESTSRYILTYTVKLFFLENY